MRIHQFSWLFFIPFCSILLGFELDVASGQSLNDQPLMLQLRNTLTTSNPLSEKLQRWNRSSDYCSWDGVTCLNGRVTGLNLSNGKISGDIENSSLFSLQNLKSLDLSYNSFSSTIPRRIGNLTNLTYLNLSNAGFGGQIPQEISDCKRLVTLDLSFNSLLVSDALKLERPNLRMLVQNLSELEKLYLDSVNISASGGEWGQALSSSLPNLREMSLSNCYLSGPLDPSLVKLQSLSMIHLGNNNLSTEVPSSFANFTNLTSLRLSSCGLYGTFPEEIFQVPTLQNIDISFNQLLSGSIPEFPQNNVLQRLVLRSTNFSGMLPTSIGHLWNLSILDLSNCRFYGPFPNSVDNLTQLVNLDLSVNKFNGTVPSFKMSKNLTKMDLSHNSLTGPISSVHWGGLLKLVYLDLGNNLLDGSIPPSLFTIPSLEKIQLPQNQFEGHLPEMSNVPFSVLDTLDLSCNKLEGPIPTSIFNLQKVSILSLSSNKLNGTVHLDNIQGLRNVTYLDLSYNNLSVIQSHSYSTWSSLTKITTLKLASCNLRVLPYLKNQSKLSYLDLSHNQINGVLPNWIWELGHGSLAHLNLSRNLLVSLQEPYTLPQSLIILDLHSNKISGNIPILPEAVFFVDLSSNNFTSSIPANVGNGLSNLFFFSLSNNALTGVIPKSICNASYLRVLDLSNNSLCGEISTCITAMSLNLGVLNLRGNKFNNSVPIEFPTDCALQTLDLNGNSLKGQISTSLARCTKLEVLNLGNNHLTGQFPCMLKNISTLRVVVLRSNNFYGKLGCPNTNGTWEMLQIVDIAHNNFSGHLKGDCLAKWKAMTTTEDDENSKLKHLRFDFLEFNPDLYYQDAITVTLKGLERELVKILTVFTSIDVSCNNFVGQIPEEFGQLHALYSLNLSHNNLTGPIPSGLGKLMQLESLDFSRNSLNGEIPRSLVGLTFLSYLNLSFNQLVGRIPSGNQLSTFSAESYIGNEGLCGAPLPVICSKDRESSNAEKHVLNSEFEWQSIYTGIGFGVGGGVVFALLMFWDEGKTWLEDNTDKILLVILPMMGYTYKARHEWDDDEKDTEYLGSDFAEDHEEDEMELNETQGPYCVFCSKLDLSREKVVHNPCCTCHSPPTSSSSSSFSSSSSSGYT